MWNSDQILKNYNRILMGFLLDYLGKMTGNLGRMAVLGIKLMGKQGLFI
jgi:hypothetical protein